jgi:hypothetical protein
MVVSGSVERVVTVASPGRQILRGLGWAAFGLCVVDGAIFTVPLPHAGPGYRAHWLPFGALIVVAVGSRIFLWQSNRRGNPKSWVSPLAWKLALLATFAAAVGCNSWLSHRADTASAATQTATEARANADQAALWSQARQIAIPVGLVVSSTFNGIDCIAEEPQHLNVGCWTSSQPMAAVKSELAAALTSQGASDLTWQCLPTGSSCTGSAAYRDGRLLVLITSGHDRPGSAARLLVYPGPPV